MGRADADRDGLSDRSNRIRSRNRRGSTRRTFGSKRARVSDSFDNEHSGSGPDQGRFELDLGC